MDISAAKAFRKRLFFEAKEARNYRPKFTGPRRRGPIYRKLLPIIHRRLQPVLLMNHGDSSGHFFLFLAQADDHPEQLVVRSLRVTKKLKVEELGFTDVRFSAHFVERLIQYFDVQEFEVLDKDLQGIFLSLAYWSGKIDGTSLTVINESGDLVGQARIIDNDFAPGLIAVTWIGERSMNPKLKEEALAAEELKLEEEE
jgi:hypothetical protein